MNTVAAVVVTFNRKNLLIECINSLLNQTKKLNSIIIIDNASTDGTIKLLEENSFLNHDLIEYKLMTENLGGAGGFHEGIKLAHAKGYEWIWVMDDDAEPLPDSLEKMTPYFLDTDTVATCPLVMDAKGVVEIPSNHRGWLRSFDGNTIIRQVTSSDTDNTNSLSIDHCSFVGLCIRASVIDKIGLPISDFFIHNDDTEYCTRLLLTGKINLITSSFIKHKEQAKIGAEIIKVVFGRRSIRIKLEKLWIQYFNYRNMVWMISNNKIKSNFGALLTRHLKIIIAVIIYDDHKFIRIRFWNSALLDGLRGIFDNKKPLLLTKSQNKYF